MTAFSLRPHYRDHARPPEDHTKRACRACQCVTLKVGTCGYCAPCCDAQCQEHKGAWYRAPLRQDRKP
jgi:hypothetical protein